MRMLIVVLLGTCGWPVSCPETIWNSGTRLTSCTLPLLPTMLAKTTRRSWNTSQTLTREGLTLHFNTHKQRCGTFLELLLTHRCYFIKTQNRRILTCNRRFLCHQTATSLFPSPKPVLLERSQNTPLQVEQSPTIETPSIARHSGRTRQAPKRLIEDATWLWW